MQGLLPLCFKGFWRYSTYPYNQIFNSLIMLIIHKTTISVIKKSKYQQDAAFFILFIWC
jgi:hypothetical protein